MTSVGGTTSGTTGLYPEPEVAAHLSGGGFSNYFPRPWYQDGPKGAVLTYLEKLGSQYDGMYKCVFCRDLT